MTDTRTPEQLTDHIKLLDKLIPMTRSVLTQAQAKLDRFERERDHAQARLREIA